MRRFFIIFQAKWSDAIFDLAGRVVVEKQADIISGGYFTTEISTNKLANGVYIVNLVTEKDTLSYKVMK
jgi:hypothetical protein